MYRSNILCHRGLWTQKKEQNSFQSLKKALVAGFSIETDIRDHNSKLIISHDPPNNLDISIDFESLLEFYNTMNCKKQILGLNIKSDGIGQKIKQSLSDYDIKNYCTFDMSIPETLKYINQKLIFLSRMSEYERNTEFSELCNGYWLDAFNSEWYSESVLNDLLAMKKNIFFVSSELHGREYNHQWKMIKKLLPSDKIFLCTDFPHKAEEYFNDKSNYF